MKIYQLVHTLNYGDAISGEALTIQRLLEKRGVSGKIYSVHAHEMVRDIVTHWSQFESDCTAAMASGEKVLAILHYSIGSPLNQAILQTSGIKRALIYHNLTPPSWFAGYNERVVADLLQGRAELPSLLEKMDVVWADSEFNAGELREFGCANASVLPLPLDTEKWRVPSNAGISRILSAGGYFNILHVGRLAPNKCIEDIIKAFYFFHHKIERRSKLWLVGIDIDTEIYSFELRRLVSRLHLKEAVSFVGAVADSELRAFYENSQLYVCMSEHEGFCLPLLEAMSFGVPAIAYDCTAVGATLGDGGVLVREKRPALIAELMHLVISDEEVRGKLIAAGRERALTFTTSRFEELFFRQLDAALNSPATSEKLQNNKKTLNAAHWT